MLVLNWKYDILCKNNKIFDFKLNGKGGKLSQSWVPLILSNRKKI